MFNWFRKPQSKPEPERPGGLFSTDFDRHIAQPTPANVHNALSKTFQKTIKDVVPVGDDGKILTGQYAMDEAYPDLQLAKLQNSFGQCVPWAQINWYASQGFIGYQTAALIAQHWLVEKACAMPAKDACRNGYEITINSGDEVKSEVLDYIRQQDKQFGIPKHCVEFVRMGRIFGIRIALFLVDSNDDKYYENPFNIDGVKPGSYKGITQIDPYWIAPELDSEGAANPASQHFYEPTWWRINGKRVHRSHLVIMRNGELPDILKPAYLYGGIPVPQKIAERVYAAERTANEAPMLAMTKRMTVYKMDLSQAQANIEGLTAKLTAWSELMNNFGIKAISGDDEVNQFDTSLTDVDAVIMTQYQIVAAAANVPATKLLGTTPKGFNATGEYEEASYHEELESIQQHDLSPLVERHHLLLIKSNVIPKFKIAPFDTEVTWKPVDSPTAAELADINLKKAQTDGTLVSAGSIDGIDGRNRLINDPHSGYNGITPISPAEQEEEAAQEYMEGPVDD